MATGHSLICAGDPELWNESLLKFLTDEMVFLPTNLPNGRFPTLTELRHAIKDLGYQLEEQGDWYVTSPDDFTEIWFDADQESDNGPVKFWFRRGDLIVLNIGQALVNQCGSLLLMGHSGQPIVLLVPDRLFSSPALQCLTGFLETVSIRLPAMIERLPKASIEDTLFILSQIRQAIRRADYYRHPEFFDQVRQGLSNYRRLLSQSDPSVRYLAFDLIATFQDSFVDNAELLGRSIVNEGDAATKARMVWAVEHLIVGAPIGSDLAAWGRVILDVLRELSQNFSEAPAVRLAAANLLARAQPGLLTPIMRSIFIDSLVQPQQYILTPNGPDSAVEQTLKSVEQVLLNHRIEILITALPDITDVQNAHDILRALLDHAFFGAIRPTSISFLPETPTASRSEADSWVYPTNPTKLASDELSSVQRQVLEVASALQTPWIVQSNLLEKYGLPPTRAALKTFLGTS